MNLVGKASGTRMENEINRDVEVPSLAAILKDARLGRKEDGTLVIDLPISLDRSQNYFLGIFGLLWIGIGVGISFGYDERG